MRKVVDSSNGWARWVWGTALVMGLHAGVAGAAVTGPPAPAAAPVERVREGAPAGRAGTPPAAATAPVAGPARVEATFQAPERRWRLLDDAFWQVVGAGEVEAPSVTDAREGTRGACAEGMVEVRGQMKDDGGDWFGVDGLQQLTCKRWLTRKFPERCAEYDAAAWQARARSLKTRPMHYCIDRFEYPNRAGANPIVMVDWYEAAALCAGEGKRLCTEDEWTFACEGEEATPYPTGYVRDPAACVVDKPWRAWGRFGRRAAPATLLELDKLWQGEASGSRPACRSAFGVYDLTGNVDEWTRSSRPGERPSVLKGGYWGPVRARCRPATKAHNQSHRFYQQGLRCCGDAPAGRG